MSRTEKVAQQLKREISKILLTEVRDPRIGFLTVTNVKVSPDLRIARVYYTILGDDKLIQSAQEGLESASGYIRKLVAHRMKIKFIPEIKFYFDQELTRRLKVDKILDELKDETSESDKKGDI
ncbi:MAG: ribosome-binding factor A [Candidatus Omnitrophica bacterium 4484_49]|nr:30S ribosome-binding factor RbfA [Candidatus Omnitrophota bacterium]OQX82504.1 MAG: ribosome-binding factor A [Candidatus Omnitrophica bacterium 4484_49]RKY35030.1 MAG: 30S ribosome-binding factor RbfA [Candidatus Omnitrophota bacterium]